MSLTKMGLIELTSENCKYINGGGWGSAIIGAAALIIAAAAAIGYYDGKEDCLPPPCE